MDAVAVAGELAELAELAGYGAAGALHVGEDPGGTICLSGVPGQAAPPRTIIAGRSAGERWAVRAGFDGAGRLSTVVTRARGDVSVASRVPPAALRAGQLVSMWLGRDPAFLLLRALPEVTFATAVLASDDRRHVMLSPVTGEVGLRFGAAPLPDEDPLVSVEVVSPLRGQQLIELWQPPARGRG